MSIYLHGFNQICVMEIIKQSNFITNARYGFTEYEMKVLIHVVKSVQDKLNSSSPEFQKNLFGEYSYTMFTNLDHIDSVNPVRIRKALVSLRKKDFQVKDNGKNVDCGFVSGHIFDEKTGKYQIEISKILMPYMVSLAQGFTTYQLDTVLHLNLHSKRLYMLFSEFANTGVFRISADSLKTNMNLQDTYDKFFHFKNRILKGSIKEINELYLEGKCDVFVELVSDKKGKHQDDFDRMLEFRITSKKKKGFVDVPQEEKVKLYQEVGGMLTAIYKSDFKLQEQMYSHFANRADMPKFHKRLVELVTDLDKQGKSYSELAPLVRTIARKDHDFEVNFSEKKAKKQDNVASALVNKFTQNK